MSVLTAKNRDKKNFDVITVGGATRDIMFYTNEGKIIKFNNSAAQRILGFELASKINIKEPHYSIGGGALNAAVGFSKMGFKTAVIVRVGDDKEGGEVIKDLKKHKINTGLVQVDKELATGFSFLVIGGRKKEYVAFLYRGANDNLRLTACNPRQFESKWFYVSSLSGDGWQKTLNDIASTVKYPSSNFKLAWNPGNLQLKAGYFNLKKYLEAADILILNKSEARELVYSSGEKVNEMRRLLKIIGSWGPKIIAVTAGAKGAWVYDGKNFYSQPAYPVKILDTTGAGDAFGSTFVACLILGDDLKRALKSAIINSASVLTQIGAHNGLLNLKELREKLFKI